MVVGSVLMGIRRGHRPGVSGGRRGDGVGVVRVVTIINIIILFIAVIVVVEVGLVVVGVFTIVYSFYRRLFLCCHYHQKTSYKTSHKTQDPRHET